VVSPVGVAEEVETALSASVSALGGGEVAAITHSSWVEAAVITCSYPLWVEAALITAGDSARISKTAGEQEAE
jgi:hypothetical protein